MSTPTPISTGLDDKVPEIENLLNVALDTLERVRDAGIVTDPVLAADVLDTIGLLIEATDDLASAEAPTPPSRALKRDASAPSPTHRASAEGSTP